MAKLNGVKVIDMVAGKIEKVTFEGAEYVLTQESPEVGDLLQMTASSVDLNNGDFHVVIDVDSDGDARYLDNVGAERCFGHFNKFRKVAAPSLESRVEALESDVAALQERAVSEVKGEADSEEAVKPIFKAGDKVSCKCDGEKLTLKERKPNQDGTRHGIAWNTEEYDYGWIGENQVELVEEKPLEVGDYVVALPSADDAYGYTNTDMKLGAVTNVSGRRIDVEIIIHEEETEVGEDYTVSAEHFRKATDAEVAEAKEALAPKAPEFSVGDYAKVVGETRYNDIKAGTTVKVTKDIDGDDEYKIKLLDDSDYDYAKPASLEKVSAEEAEKKAKWAKIGREVDEYKEGDIVFVSKDNRWFSNDEELLAEVVGGNPGGVLVNARYEKDRFLGLYIVREDLTLVTPVESRFDR